jgi:hypothetical protein
MIADTRHLCPMLTTSWVSTPHPFRGAHYLGGEDQTPRSESRMTGACLVLPHRHQHGLDHELAILMGTHQPTRDDPRIQIQHHAEVQPMFSRPNVGDIRTSFVLRAAAVKSRFRNSCPEKRGRTHRQKLA